MPVKSIVDVEIDPNGAFTRFSALWDKYQKSLKDSPKEWAKVTQGMGQARSEFEQIVKQQIASQARAKLIAEAQKEASRVMGDNERRTKSWAEAWGVVAGRAQSVARSVGGIANTLTRVGALGGVFTGLLGTGGLFGIDRLAGSVSAGRRSSLGLGIGYGEQRSFGVNFDRLVDPGSFLSSVAGAKFDVTRRVGLLGAGLSQREIGGDTGQTAVALLDRLKQIADRTDPGLFAQVLTSRRLDQFASPEDLNRLRNTSPAEYAKLRGQYGQNSAAFGLPADVQRSWQEFTTQMGRAGQGIENTFVRGLAPLAPGLTKLSESFEKVVRSFLSSPALEKWIKNVDGALEKFAGYIGTDDFQKKVSSFVSGVASLAESIGRAVSWFASNTRFGAEGNPQWDAHQGRVDQLRKDRAEGRSSAGSQFLDIFRGGSPGSRPGNNPGNLRPPGASTGFMNYSSSDEGVRAMADQIRLYGRRDRLDTVAQIVAKYAPASENNTAAYVSDVSRRSGIAPNQRIDVGNSEMLARLLSAMIAHEQRAGSFDKYKDAKVVVEIIKPAGGDTAVSVNGLKN